MFEAVITYFTGNGKITLEVMCFEVEVNKPNQTIVFFRNQGAQKYRWKSSASNLRKLSRTQRFSFSK